MTPPCGSTFSALKCALTARCMPCASTEVVPHSWTTSSGPGDSISGTSCLRIRAGDSDERAARHVLHVLANARMERATLRRTGQVVCRL